MSFIAAAVGASLPTGITAKARRKAMILFVPSMKASR